MPPRKETRSLTELLADAAYRKSRDAQVQIAAPPPGPEAAREVYLAACTSIGMHLEESFGFKYAKSGPRARRQSGDFTFHVSFQSSHYNIAGEHVALWIHSVVRSERIKAWREGQPHLRVHLSDYVAGGQVGNLQADHDWLEWELAKRRKREERIRDAIKTIENLALPYFARFEDVPALIAMLVKEDMPSMAIDVVIEFLMCFADQPTARLAAANFLANRPELHDEYKEYYARCSKDGGDSLRGKGYAGQLALASHAYRFGDLTTRHAWHNA